jgi:protein-L-isoaspartate(D-aspartate) O-methyltransferase
MDAHELARRELAAAAEPWEAARPDPWAPVPPELDRAIAADRRLAAAGRRARADLIRVAGRRLGDLIPPEVVSRYAGALADVPRERFVLPEQIASSAEDEPSPLDRWGLATVSAPHSYILTYGLCGLDAGDHLIELGSGTGYGAALASRVVGPRGRISSIEIDPDLHARAVRLLSDPEVAGPAPITLLSGDARTLAPSLFASRDLPLRVVVTYALPAPPEPLIALLPEGGALVAPVGDEGEQVLTRWIREGGTLSRSTHGLVRYVPERALPAPGL